MKLAESMKNITENIIACHNVRIKALGDLVDQVNMSMEEITANRKKIGAEQAAELVRFAGGLASDVGKKLKGFRYELEIMSKDRVISAKELRSKMQKEAKELANMVKKSLGDYRKDHAEMSAAMRKNLGAFVKGIVGAVGKNLGGYRKDHAEMSAAMRKNLGAFVKGIVGAVGDLTASTRGMMQHYRDDIHRASEAWQHMAHTLAKARGEAVAGSEGEAAESAEGAVRKIKRRRKKRK